MDTLLKILYRGYPTKKYHIIDTLLKILYYRYPTKKYHIIDTLLKNKTSKSHCMP